MENKYRFGKIDVNCEGYDYPTDLYILRGSCGLEYTIELTDEGRAKQGSSDYHGRNNYQYGSRNRYNNSSALREVVMFVIVAVIFYMVFKTYTDTVPPVYSQDPNMMGRPGPSAPPPPYSPEPPGFKREYTQ
ncbi:Store-operated calcium entry-associated regulatory factor, partial, partial [Paramuricea clavata]